MRAIILVFLILTATLSISQTKNSDVKVNIKVSPEKITVTLKSGSDSHDHFKVKIIDSNKNIVKNLDLPKATKQIESSIAILDFDPGNYTCLVYKEEEELYKGEFFKDAIFAEPQTERRSPN